MTYHWRETVALWSPGILAFLFMALMSNVRWLPALVLAALLPVGAILGYIVCFVALSKVLGPLHSAGDPWQPTHHLATGILLATLVWVWWQADQRATEEAVMECMESSDDSAFSDSPIQLVSTCFDRLGHNVGYE